MKRLLCLLGIASLACHGVAVNPSTQSEEADLIALIQSNTASLHDRGVACRRLAALGSRRAIGPLVSLLDHPQLAHLARYGLEPMPYPEVDTALRNALEQLRGVRQIGVINSLGVRRDPDAVDPLSALVASDDARVSEAAAAALGQIGTREAARVLKAALRDAVAQRRFFLADAGLTCGDRLMASEDWSAAREVFDGLNDLELPSHLSCAAMRGAILARRDGGVRLLERILRDDDEPMILLGIRVAREIRGVRATRALAKLLPDLRPSRQALLVTALGDRGDLAALEAVIDLSRRGAREARVAALRALVGLPAASVIPVLVQAGVEEDVVVSKTARSALLELPEGKTDRMLAAQLESSDPAVRLFMIDLLGRRRASEAQEVLLSLTHHDDETTRLAAIKALGNVLTPAGWPSLVACLVRAPTGEQRGATDAALETACARFDDKEACAPALATAMDAADEATKVLLVRRMGQAGGVAGYKAVSACAVPGNPHVLRDAAIRAITEWPGVEALAELRTWLESPPDNNDLYRTLAFRGFVRVVRDSDLPSEEKLKRLREAMTLARDLPERRLALGAVGSVATTEALDAALAEVGNADLSAEAASAILRICGDLDPGQHRSDIRGALQTLVEQARDASTVRQARTLLRGLDSR